MESGWSEERKIEITEYIEAYKKNEYDNDRIFVYQGGLVVLDKIRKLIDDMSKEYGEDFIWWDVSAFGFSTESIARFINELKTELSTDDPFAADEVIMVAKCDANDDVLFYSPKLGELRIYHLTWSHCREKEGFPTCVRFESAESAAAYIKQNFEEDYL